MDDVLPRGVLPDGVLPGGVLPGGDFSDEGPLAAAQAHIEETAQSIAQIHAAHHQGTTSHQRGIDHVTGLLSRPWFIAVLGLLITAWMVANLLADPLHYASIDPPPFPTLATVISLISLSIVLLVLATQRRATQLAEKREQLSLELALLSERKSAKIIELLEEFRRDLPLVHDRVDQQADALAQPANAQQVLDVIEQTHARAVAPQNDPEGEARG
jgi:uncharacterized membrane protein